MSDRALDRSDPDRLLSSPGVLGAQCRTRGDFAGAEPLLREALAIAESTRPRDGQALALALNELGLLCKDLGRWDEARAAILDGLERYDEAERLYREAIALFEREPMDPLELAVALGGLGAQYVRRGCPGEAVPLLARAVELKRQALGSRHPDTALTLHNLAVARDRAGDAAGAAAEAAEATAVLHATLEPGHPRLVACAGTAWSGAA